MKEFNVVDVERLGITEKEFELLVYVFSDSIKKYTPDKNALDELKKYFSIENYRNFKNNLT